jgi:hypothetical protein
MGNTRLSGGHIAVQRPAIETGAALCTSERPQTNRGQNRAFNGTSAPRSPDALTLAHRAINKHGLLPSHEREQIPIARLVPQVSTLIEVRYRGNTPAPPQKSFSTTYLVLLRIAFRQSSDQPQTGSISSVSCWRKTHETSENIGLCLPFAVLTAASREP